MPKEVLTPDQVELVRLLREVAVSKLIVRDCLDSAVDQFADLIQKVDDVDWDWGHHDDDLDWMELKEIQDDLTKLNHRLHRWNFPSRHWYDLPEIKAESS